MQAEASTDIWKKLTMKQAHEEYDNLSVAWANTFLKALNGDAPRDRPAHVTVRLPADGVPFEDTHIRAGLDGILRKRGLLDVHGVANTIFPASLWNPSLGAESLYERYLQLWPRLHKCPANRRGHYFSRFVAARPKPDKPPVNQLKHVISTWKRGNHRNSALQLAVFDPALDHVHARQLGFPCLHQVCLTPIGPNGRDGLTITGFYATQRLLDKGYGNFLGLCRLGAFMAHEMGLRLTRMTDIMASPRAYDTQQFNAPAMREFAALLRARLDSLAAEAPEALIAAKEQS